jgi:hypothetical protein
MGMRFSAQDSRSVARLAIPNSKRVLLTGSSHEGLDFWFRHSKNTVWNILKLRSDEYWRLARIV